MLKQIEGSRAVADAVAMSRPEVICAYPITPQTHIVEALSAKVKKGELAAEFLNVELEFAALSAVIGASAAGARTYTATGSQGLLFMSEAVYNASGLGLPIVMTVANRAIGAPINIWNDHSDAMSQRDSGWIQLYAETSQEAVDLHIQAFRITEQLSLPVMVCMDGFLLTHASERVDLPEPGRVDVFLPPYEPRQLLDPADPVSIGAMVGPEAFAEVRYLAYRRMQDALDVIPQVSAGFRAGFGRSSGGLVQPYRTEDAEIIVVALGSVLGTIKDTADELRADGIRIGVLGITTFRPFPVRAVREVLGTGSRLQRLIVLGRALAPGTGDIVTGDIRRALAAEDGRRPHAPDVITGVQRSGATPPAARTATTQAVGDKPGNTFGQGKNVPLIAMAHEIPYVATATVAGLRDLEYKATRAMDFHGARYLHILVPCPLGWGSASADTIKVARLATESGMFPVFEAEDGAVVSSTPIRHQVPVEGYLRLQARYAHLFRPAEQTATIARIQAIADRNVARFNLLSAERAVVSRP
jgi:pyruvate ferredoxin oxidoreductase alpha subunit